MAGRSAKSNNWGPNSPETRYEVSGKNREFYTFENAPGLGAYAIGGTIIDGGDGYIYHIFTGDGTFTVNRPSAAIDSVEYLIVAGGGAGGEGFYPPAGLYVQPTRGAGAGGGGGAIMGAIPVSIGSYPISVGAGGPPVPRANIPNNASNKTGNSSSAFGITSAGGGGGGCIPTSPNANVALQGASGGSGGGGTNFSPSGGVGGGTGDTPSTIPRQGHPGGTSSPSFPTTLGRFGGGGGGAGGAGGAAPSFSPPYPLPSAGTAGSGKIFPSFPLTIISKAIPSADYPQWNNDTATGLAAGGTSWYWNNNDPEQPVGPNAPAAANTGKGADANSELSRAGGSGIVCIRYKKTAAYQRATGGTIEPNTHPEHPGVWRHIFTEPGTFEVTDPTLQWIDYLAVGGGGGGGGSPAPPIVAAGGGGAGGFVSSIHTSTSTPLAIPEAYPWSPGYSVEVGKQYPVGVGTYPIGIGTGGDASTTGNDTTIGNPGASQIIAYGGGAGATAPGSGGAGGSGGGGAKLSPSTVQLAGGTATPTPLIQGNNGGTTPSISTPSFGGGGGGAGAVGSGSGAGGAGWYSVLSPSAYGTPGPLTPTSQYRYFAGGGGGYPTQTGSPGGGGGDGGVNAGNPGTTNTGGGGGGGFGGPGGSGGPGIVIIQYPE